MNTRNSDCKVLLWTLSGGMVYYAIEGLWRIPQGGWAHVAMLFVGGICFVGVGRINQIPAFYNLSMRWQSVIGALIVLVVEFLSGCILNLWLDLEIWNYSHLPLNLYGQICLPFAVVWFLLMPFAIWLEDRLTLLYWLYSRYRWQELTEIRIYDYTLKQAYKEWFFGR